MTTPAKKMGEQSNGTVKPRDMGNKVLTFRDDGALFLKKHIIERLEEITTNKVDEKEAMEGICAEVVREANTLYEGFLAVGAQIDPIAEIEARVSRERIELLSVRA